MVRSTPEEWRDARHTCYLILAVSLIVVLCIFAFQAWGHDATHPEWDAWFVRQHNMRGTSCCDLSHAHYVKDGDWGIAGQHYWVIVEGNRYVLDDEQVVRTKPDDPNPTERALVWYAKNTNAYNKEEHTYIYCFLPSSLM